MCSVWPMLITFGKDRQHFNVQYIYFKNISKISVEEKMLGNIKLQAIKLFLFIPWIAKEGCGIWYMLFVSFPGIHSRILLWHQWFLHKHCFNKALLNEVRTWWRGSFLLWRPRNCQVQRVGEFIVIVIWLSTWLY